MTRLQRDRRTWLTYAQLGCYGWFLYGFGPSLTLLRDGNGEPAQPRRSTV